MEIKSVNEDLLPHAAFRLLGSFISSTDQQTYIRSNVSNLITLLTRGSFVSAKYQHLVLTQRLN